MRNSGLWVILTVLVTACGAENSVTPVKRVGMITGIREDKIPEYKALHAATWEGVLQKISKANIRNYSIFLKQVDSSYYLFSYYEYIGADYAADMQKIAADTVTQRWWKETAPCQLPLPEAAEKGEVWTEMEEVFHTDGLN